MVSAIGDDVNVAARLEGLSKQYHAPIIVSKALITQAGIKDLDKPLYQAMVKGRKDTVHFYALEEVDMP